LSWFRHNVGIDGAMAILIFILSVVLLVAGAASGYASLDLLPLSNGVLYALAGAVAVCAAIVTFALGVAILRIDGLAKLMRQPLAPPPENLVEAAEAAAAVDTAPAPAADAEAPAIADTAVSPEGETPANEYRAGHLPSLDEIETVLETPESPPGLIGRYSSGGASYMIFADGSIEAETLQGTFRFASMGEFKRYVAERDGDKAG
jgi:hypothetical protein